MQDLLDPEVITEVLSEPAERIECSGKCHKGPIDDSPKALRYAAHHDPEAPAAFLLVCPGCDTQWPLCAKKVQSMQEWHTGNMRCNNCTTSIPFALALLLPINH